MKNIFKALMLSLVVITVSCENDDKTSVTSPIAPVLLNPATSDVFTLRPEKANDLATTFVWNHAEYGVQTAVNYSVEFAVAGTSFAEVIDGGSPFNNQKFKAFTVVELNTVAETAGLIPFQNGDLDVRIKSWLGENVEMVSYSAPITITINRYTNELPKLWVPGKYQPTSGYGNNEWSHATAPQLAAEAYGKKDYEGYVYISSNQTASNDGFKISTQANWDGQNYGDDGSFSGVLSASGDNILTNAGYYWIKANPFPFHTQDNPNGMKYSLTKTDWAVTGSATPNGWPDNGVQDHDMTYDVASKTWTTTLVLSTGELKFRANNDWAINYGDAAGDGVLDFNNGTNIQVTAAGTYLIKLNLSDPRKYTYTLTKQ